MIWPAFPLRLAAGKSAAITLEFAPNAFERALGTIAFISTENNAVAGLTVNGWGVRGKLVGSYRTMDLGKTRVGATVALLQTLTNLGASPVTILSANTNGSAFGRTGITPPITLAPGSKVTFSVFFRPTSSGPASGGITVISDASEPTLTVPLVGTGMTGGTGTLTVSPVTTDLGSAAVGANKTSTVMLTAKGTNITISSATTTSSEFTLRGAVFPLVVTAGRSVPLTIVFTPKSSGSTSAKLSFLSDATNSPAVQSVTGTGIAATQRSVALAWTASRTPVAGYNIFRGTKAGGPYIRVNSSLNSHTAFTDSSVSLGQTYYYVVTGVDSVGLESVNSNEVVAAIPSI